MHQAECLQWCKVLSNNTMVLTVGAWYWYNVRVKGDCHYRSHYHHRHRHHQLHHNNHHVHHCPLHQQHIKSVANDACSVQQLNNNGGRRVMPILRSVSPKPVSQNYSALPPIALIHWSPQTLINARGIANSCTWSFWGLSSQVGIFEQWQKLPKMTKIAENDKNQRKWHTLPKMTKKTPKLTKITENDKNRQKWRNLPQMTKVSENDQNFCLSARSLGPRGPLD